MNLDSFDLQALLNAVGGNAALSAKPIDAKGKTVPLTKSFSTQVGQATISANIGATASITLFQSNDGASDEDALIVDSTAKQDEDTLPPPVAIPVGQAALKYRLGATISGTAGATLSQLGIAVDATAAFAFGYYSLHPADMTLGAAIRYDVGGFRHPFSVAEITALTPGDAVFLSASGKLSFKLTYNAADLLAGNFTAVQAALGGAGLVKGTFSGSVSVDFKASVTDTFVVCFSRDNEPGTRVSLHKAKTTDIGGGVKASFEFDYATTDSVNGLVNEVFQKVLSAPQDVIADIQGASGYDTLSNNQKYVVDQLISRLPPLVVVTDKLAKFKQLVTDLQTALQSKLKDKLTAAWSYDYDRVKENDTVLVARLSDAALARFHDELLFLDTASLLAAARQTVAPAQGITLEKLLLSRSVTTTQTWGFSLGLGGFKLGATQKLTDHDVTRENAAGDKRLVFDGTAQRTFDSSWELQGSTVCGLDASMSAYQTSPAPADFDYTMRLGWELTNFTGSDDRLAKALDEAIVFGALDDAVNRYALATQLRASLSLDTWTDAKFVAGIELNAAATNRLLAAAAAISAGSKSRLFAGAMAFLMYKDAIGREAIAVREQIYTSIFDQIAQLPNDDATDIEQSGLVAQAVRNAVAWNKYYSLANREDQAGTTDPLYMHGLLYLLDHHRDGSPDGFDKPWDDAMAAMTALAAAAAAPGGNLGAITAARGALERIWVTPFFIRTLARLITFAAVSDPVLKSGLTITAALKGSVNGTPVSHPLP